MTKKKKRSDPCYDSHCAGHLELSLRIINYQLTPLVSLHQLSRTQLLVGDDRIKLSGENKQDLTDIQLLGGIVLGKRRVAICQSKHIFFSPRIPSQTELGQDSVAILENLCGQICVSTASSVLEAPVPMVMSTLFPFNITVCRPCRHPLFIACLLSEPDYFTD